MIERGSELAVRFYRSPAGNDPIREWLRAQEKEVRKAVGQDIRIVQTNWPIGMPLVRALGGGLWELRTNCRGNTYRVMFAVEEGTMFLLHAFEKKTRATRAAHLHTARKRQKEGMS